MKPVRWVLLMMAFALTPVSAQPVMVLEGRELVSRDCGTLVNAVAAGQLKTACYTPTAGVSLRCLDVDRSRIGEFCKGVQAALERGALARLDSIRQDITRGFTRAGGRRADQENCLPGLPQDELLIPSGRLQILPLAAGLRELQSLVVVEEQAGRPLATYPAVGAGGVAIDAGALRGRKLVLRALDGSRAVSCKFTVLGGDEAQRLIKEFAQLQQTGAAGLIEQAAFFRENDFWHEYWRAIDGLRQR